MKFLSIAPYRFHDSVLSSRFFLNLGHIRLLHLESCDFSNVPSDAFKSMINLEALKVTCPQKFSHIELKDLFKLKWLRFILDAEEIPNFYQANSDLKVLEIYLEESSLPNSSLSLNNVHHMFNFRQLLDFSFIDCNNYLDFNADWLLGKNLKQFKPEFDEIINTCHASSLRYLRMENVKSIKGSFSSFVNLRLLDLRLNSSIELQPGMFNGLVYLKDLDLDRTRVICSMLPSDLFNGLVNLKRLNMGKCKLKTLPDGLFSTLARLQVLKLHNFDSLELTANTFKGLDNLRELCLISDFWPIDCVRNWNDQDVFIHFKKLEKFFLKSISIDSKEQLIAKYPKFKTLLQKRHH